MSSTVVAANPRSAKRRVAASSMSRRRSDAVTRRVAEGGRGPKLPGGNLRRRGKQRVELLLPRRRASDRADAERVEGRSTLTWRRVSRLSVCRQGSGTSRARPALVPGSSPSSRVSVQPQSARDRHAMGGAPADELGRSHPGAAAALREGSEPMVTCLPRPGGCCRLGRGRRTSRACRVRVAVCRRRRPPRSNRERRGTRRDRGL